MSNLGTIASKKIAEAPEKVDNGIVWYQFNPDGPEGLQKQNPTRPSSATIHAVSRKLIAREWRRAFGKPRRNTRLERLTSEAESWAEREALEKRKKEEEEAERRKLGRYIQDLNHILMEFASRLADAADESDSIAPDEMFEECLREVCNPHRVEWSEDGCRIWFEPWEEIRARRIAKVTDPVIYTAFIDKDMNITSFAKNSKE